MTVFDDVGGAAAFDRLAAALHARCLVDPVLEHPFTHADANPEHVPRLARYLAEVFGGPRSGVDHVGMLDMHAHQGMDPDLGTRFYGCFEGALDDVAITASPAREALLRYMRWAVDDVLQYDDPAVTVPRDVPMPRRG